VKLQYEGTPDMDAVSGKNCSTSLFVVLSGSDFFQALMVPTSSTADYSGK
jgi:hypothetical protein